MRPVQRLNGFVARRTRRPTSALAEDVSALGPEARAAAVYVWTRRSLNESASVSLAERLAANVGEAGLDSPLARAMHGAFVRLGEDEASHVFDANEVLAALGQGAPPNEVELRAAGSSPLSQLVHDVAVGLFLCESVSASRFASVWAATDLPAFRERIGVFLRDEIAHAALGRHVLPLVLAAYERRVGPNEARRFVTTSLETATAELVAIVAQGTALVDLPPPRPQPTGNPGIVEPAADARALYRTLERTVQPFLGSLVTGNMHTSS